jgi:hypothetical protein
MGSRGVEGNFMRQHELDTGCVMRMMTEGGTVLKVVMMQLRSQIRESGTHAAADPN